MHFAKNGRGRATGKNVIKLRIIMAALLAWHLLQKINAKDENGGPVVYEKIIFKTVFSGKFFMRESRNLSFLSYIRFEFSRLFFQGR